MNIRLITLPLFFAALASCDKIKNVADKAKTAMKQEISNKTVGKKNIPGDPELMKLVDQTAEGAVFRKDLPFPQNIEVKSSRRSELSVRNMQASEIEKHAEKVNGVQITIRKLERKGGQVVHTLEQSSFVIPTLDPKDPGKKIIEKPVKQANTSATPITFQFTGNGWKGERGGEFKSVVLSKELSPVFEVLLLENALTPRPLWFAKKRLKPGDSLVVADESLAMLFAGNAKGSVTLKLESFEPVEGHPCGVFSITGKYSRKNFPDFEAVFRDEDVTIQSGKVWLSLIYPIVLKQELDTIQNINAGGQGGLVTRSQGSAIISQVYDWKSLKP